VPLYPVIRNQPSDERGHLMGETAAVTPRSAEALRVAAGEFTAPDAQRLVEEVQAEYLVLYGSPDETALEEGVFDPPSGAFFLGYVGDEPVAMGGWRLRRDVLPFGGTLSAEVKRMYVVPGARRRGYAREVLDHLETTAREVGADAMVLETGTEQPAAIRMYLAAGYELVESFGYYAWSPKSRSYGKRL
jgi:GNAT superfamily N-acetyltransferase